MPDSTGAMFMARAQDLQRSYTGELRLVVIDTKIRNAVARYHISWVRPKSQKRNFAGVFPQSGNSAGRISFRNRSLAKVL
jgi:hypothetical protein